jgi:hypothetical protein
MQCKLLTDVCFQQGPVKHIHSLTTDCSCMHRFGLVG